MSKLEQNELIRTELFRNCTPLRYKTLVRSDSFVKAFSSWKSSNQPKKRLTQLRQLFEATFFNDLPQVCEVVLRPEVQKVCFFNPTEHQIAELQYLTEYVVEQLAPTGFVRYEAEEWGLMVVEEGIQTSQRYFLMLRQPRWKRLLPSRFFKCDRLIIECSTLEGRQNTLTIRFFPGPGKTGYHLNNLLAILFREQETY